jgi:putative oxidoreductase
MDGLAMSATAGRLRIIGRSAKPGGIMSDAVNVGLLALRVGLGLVFLAHGIKHARGRAKTTAWFAGIGFHSPGMQWLASTATELGVGLLLLAGLGTGVAAAGVIGIMTVAFWTVHRKAGFFITAFMKRGVDVEGWEYVATLWLIAAVLAITGAGEIAVDWQITIDGVHLGELLDGRVGGVLVLGAIAVSAFQVLAFWRPEDVS